MLKRVFLAFVWLTTGLVAILAVLYLFFGLRVRLDGGQAGHVNLGMARADGVEPHVLTP